MTVVKRYRGINLELLCDVVADIVSQYGFSVKQSGRTYLAGEKSGLKGSIFGTKSIGWFSSETFRATVVGQLDSDTVLTLDGEPEMEEAVASELNNYFARMEVNIYPPRRELREDEPRVSHRIPVRGEYY